MSKESSPEKIKTARLEAVYSRDLMSDAEIALDAFRAHNGQTSVRNLVGFIEVRRSKDVRKRLSNAPYVFDQAGYFNFLMLTVAPEFDPEEKRKFIEEKTETPYPSGLESPEREERMRTLQNWHLNRVFRLTNPQKFLQYVRTEAKKLARETIQHQNEIKKLMERREKEGSPFDLTLPYNRDAGFLVPLDLASHPDWPFPKKTKGRKKQRVPG